MKVGQAVLNVSSTFFLNFLSRKVTVLYDNFMHLNRIEKTKQKHVLTLEKSKKLFFLNSVR